MESSLYARGNAIVPIVATSTLAGKENYFYKLDGDNQAIIIASAADIPDGVIGAVTVDGLEISALKQSGNHSPVRVKLGAAVTDLRLDLQLRADGTVGPDAATGARVIVARPLETGAADEFIQAILLPPKVYAAPTQSTLTDSSTGTASTTLAAITSTTPADLAAVGVQLGVIKNAIASLAARLAEVKTDTTVRRTA